MRLNLPENKVAEIIASLEKRNAAVYSVNEWNSYYFTYAEINKVENFVEQFVIGVHKAETKLIEELKVKGKSMGYKMVVLVRDQDLKPHIANGKILYMYYFTNEKLNTVISEDIIKEEDQLELERKVTIIED